jgi:hypothetical protein
MICIGAGVAGGVRGLLQQRLKRFAYFRAVRQVDQFLLRKRDAEVGSSYSSLLNVDATNNGSALR